jgi:hypothetical protein
MKVLRLQIQSEHVGEQDIQRARKIPHGIRLQVAWRVERSGPCFGISNSNLHFLPPFVSLNARSDERTYAHPSSTFSIRIGDLRISNSAQRHDVEPMIRWRRPTLMTAA